VKRGPACAVIEEHIQSPIEEQTHALGAVVRKCNAEGGGPLDAPVARLEDERLEHVEESVGEKLLQQSAAVKFDQFVQLPISFPPVSLSVSSVLKEKLED